jgi:VanZ family protein
MKTIIFVLKIFFMKRLLYTISQYHLVTISCVTGILLVCLIRLPDNDTGSNIPYFDKIVHFGLFFTLSTGLLIENFINKKWLKKVIIIRTIVFSAVFGALIEFLQKFLTTYRSADVLDWFADLTGVTVAIILSLLFLFKKE